MTRRALFFHPMLRNYRLPLFEKLSAYGVDFLFTGAGGLLSPGGERRHIREEAGRLLRGFTGNYTLAKEWTSLSKGNFSLDIFQQTLFGGYSTHIYSGVTSLPYLLTAPLARLLGKKIILFDELWCYPDEMLSYRMLKPVASMNLKLTHHVIATGSQARKMFIEKFQVTEDKISTAYNTAPSLENQPVDGERSQEIAHSLGQLSQGRKVILYLGRFVPYKGADLLIRAASSLPEDSCLILVGEGSHKDECIRLTKELSLENRVHFVPGCDSQDVRYFFENCTLFVMPARFVTGTVANCEAWGFTLNEAMGLGVPCLATDAVGAAHDLIEDGDTGFLFTGHNHSHLSDKITQLLSNLDWLKQVGHAGKLRLNQQCNYLQNEETFLRALEA